MLPVIAAQNRNSCCVIIIIIIKISLSLLLPMLTLSVDMGSTFKAVCLYVGLLIYCQAVYK